MKFFCQCFNDGFVIERNFKAFCQNLTYSATSGAELTVDSDNEFLFLFIIKDFAVLFSSYLKLSVSSFISICGEMRSYKML